MQIEMPNVKNTNWALLACIECLETGGIEQVPICVWAIWHWQIWHYWALGAQGTFACVCVLCRVSTRALPTDWRSFWHIICLCTGESCGSSCSCQFLACKYSCFPDRHAQDLLIWNDVTMNELITAGDIDSDGTDAIGRRYGWDVSWWVQPYSPQAQYKTFFTITNTERLFPLHPWHTSWHTWSFLITLLMRKNWTTTTPAASILKKYCRLSPAWSFRLIIVLPTWYTGDMP